MLAPYPLGKLRHFSTQFTEIILLKPVLSMYQRWYYVFLLLYRVSHINVEDEYKKEKPHVTSLPNEH